MECSSLKFWKHVEPLLLLQCGVLSFLIYVALSMAKMVLWTLFAAFVARNSKMKRPIRPYIKHIQNALAMWNEWLTSSCQSVHKFTATSAVTWTRSPQMIPIQSPYSYKFRRQWRTHVHTHIRVCVCVRSYLNYEKKIRTQVRNGEYNARQLGCKYLS